MIAADLASLSQIAFASYFDLVAGPPGADSLRDSGKGMAAAQAEAFSAKYVVALPTYHDPASDLDITVFKDASGSLTLGIRGTLPGHDLTVTDAQIALHGAGYDQIVALYNWWQRVSNPVESSVSQFSLTEYVNGSAPLGAMKLFDTSSAFGGRAMYLEAAPSTAATGELTAALAADPDQKIDVTGHSLGAHLALAFNALFPSAVGQAVGFDTPGFRSSEINQQFFAALGGAVPTNANSGNFVSVVADEASVGEVPFNAIAGVWSRPGLAVNISIENQWLSDEPVPESVRNHSMKMLADSLATYNLLRSLDPGLGATTYKQLLNGAANGSKASYERVIDALEASFNVNQIPLSAGNDQRDALYVALYGLRDGPVLQSLASKVVVQLATAGNLASEAKTDFSAFLSLQTLSPIVLRTDTAGEAILKQANKTLAQQWEADQALTATERAAGLGNFTGTYLHDRQAVLQGLISHNIADKSYEIASGKKPG